MFDWFEPSKDRAGEFRCKKCDAEVTGMQTKGFGCDLGTVRMLEDGSLESKSAMYEDDDERCQRWRIIKDTCYARVYSSCRNDNLWNEWRIHVREGKVLEIVRIEID